MEAITLSDVNKITSSDHQDIVELTGEVIAANSEVNKCQKELEALDLALFNFNSAVTEYNEKSSRVKEAMHKVLAKL